MPSELKQVLKWFGIGSAPVARGALPVNGLTPIVADVNRLRLDSPVQSDPQPPLLDLEAAE